MRKTLGQLVAFLHNLWAQGPINSDTARKLWPAVQGVIVVLVLALWAFFQGFGWYVPTDPTNVHLWLAEFGNAAVLAFAVAYPIVTQRLWPALVPYLMAFLQLFYQIPASATPGYKPARVIALWAVAA